MGAKWRSVPEIQVLAEKLRYWCEGGQQWLTEQDALDFCRDYNEKSPVQRAPTAILSYIEQTHLIFETFAAAQSCDQLRTMLRRYKVRLQQARKLRLVTNDQAAE